jgi:hypothetical protein
MRALKMILLTFFLAIVSVIYAPLQATEALIHVQINTEDKADQNFVIFLFGGCK